VNNDERQNIEHRTSNIEHPMTEPFDPVGHVVFSTYTEPPSQTEAWLALSKLGRLNNVEFVQEVRDMEEKKPGLRCLVVWINGVQREIEMRRLLLLESP
jgi:hypothetical protein